ncbi:hypothetical protein MMPV_007878 [Pyropia vietnamensis]
MVSFRKVVTVAIAAVAATLVMVNDAVAKEGAPTEAKTTVRHSYYGPYAERDAMPAREPPSFTKAEWEAKLAAEEVDRPSLNKLVMDYLVIEGYKEAAEAFSQEVGVSPGVELSTITDRMIIRQAIQEGDIDEAMSGAAALDPAILLSNPTLVFHLHQQLLIELIRAGKTGEALSFATTELAPTASGGPDSTHLAELEATLTLLAFDHPADADECPVASLLLPSQRQKIASELNAAILASQNQETMPRLPGLLRKVLWAEGQLEEKWPPFHRLPHSALPASASMQAHGSTLHRCNSSIGPAMNIFYLSADPVVAAAGHCNKHLPKMIVEAAQLLSCIHRQTGSAPAGAYAATRAAPRSHPVMVWLAESAANFKWAADLGFALAARYTAIYGRTHKSEAVLRAVAAPPAGLPRVGRTPMRACVPEDCRVSVGGVAVGEGRAERVAGGGKAVVSQPTDPMPVLVAEEEGTGGGACEPAATAAAAAADASAILSYRLYYVRHKRRFAVWPPGETPPWFVEGVAAEVAAGREVAPPPQWRTKPLQRTAGAPAATMAAAATAATVAVGVADRVSMGKATLATQVAMPEDAAVKAQTGSAGAAATNGLAAAVVVLAAVAGTPRGPSSVPEAVGNPQPPRRGRSATATSAASAAAAVATTAGSAAAATTTSAAAGPPVTAGSKRAASSSLNDSRRRKPVPPTAVAAATGLAVDRAAAAAVRQAPKR